MSDQTVMLRLLDKIDALEAENQALRDKLAQVREGAAERKRRQRERDMSRDGHVTTDVISLSPPVPPTSPAPRTPHPHPPHNPPLNPAHAPAHVGTPEPLPFEEGPVGDPGDGDDVLDVRIPAFVQVPAAGRGLSPAPKPRDVYPFEFEGFWKPYPRKVSKDEAVKSWKRAIAQGAQPADIVAGLERWLGSVDWKDAEKRYLPHPTTWLNQRRWLDEPEQVVTISPATAPLVGDPLAWARRYVADYDSHAEGIRALVGRARAVNKVVLDASEALEVLAAGGLDAALAWVLDATRIGMTARSEVARG